MFSAQAFYLFLTIALTFIWVNQPILSRYTFQLIAALALIFFLFQFRSKNQPNSPKTLTFDLLILIILTLLLVTETGGLTSPLMFLTYLLLFAIALIFHIQTTLNLTLALILYFVFLPSTDLTQFTTITEIIALLLITPLAIFTGHQYELALQEKQHLEHEETDTLLFLTLKLKKTLTKTLDTLSYVVPKISNYTNRHYLQTIYQDLHSLYQSSQELELDIDHETDHV